MRYNLKQAVHYLETEMGQRARIEGLWSAMRHRGILPEKVGPEGVTVSEKELRTFAATSKEELLKYGDILQDIVLLYALDHGTLSLWTGLSKSAISEFVYRGCYSNRKGVRFKDMATTVLGAITEHVAPRKYIELRVWNANQLFEFLEEA